MERLLKGRGNGINIATVFLCIIYMAPLLLSINHPTLTKVSSMIIIILSLLIWHTDKFYFVLPIFIFFNTDLLLPGDLLAYRVYSFLVLFKIIYSNKIKIDKVLLLPFLIFIFYCIAIMAYYSLITSIIVIFDLFVIVLYISVFLRKNIKIFFSYYIYGTIISCLYGWFIQEINNNTFINIENQWVETSRYMGSFIDPNYFGFFLNIAIFAVIILNVINNKFLKIGLLIFLYTSLISTLSITGISCNILMLCLYLLLSRKMHYKYISLIIGTGLLLYMNIDFIVDVEISLISDMAKRLNSKLSVSSIENFSGFTTGRSSIWIEHLNYFSQQPMINILFGGNFLTDFGMEEKFTYVSHQAYIDMLINFGLIGTALLLSFLVYLIIEYIKIFLKSNNTDLLFLVVVKFIWGFYAFGLSMFPSWTFNLFFLL